VVARPSGGTVRGVGVGAVERFPDENPNPVLRIADDGVVLYANAAARPILNGWRAEVGERLDADIVADIGRHAATDPPTSFELDDQHRTYGVLPVHVADLGFYNVYGTDITARKAIDKFPNENPHPVIRLSRTGRLTYANPASEKLRRALGVEVGEEIDAELFGRILAGCDRPDEGVLEIATEGTTYEVRAVSVFEFDSINLYGTDVTAARQVERLNAENEALLLNILPRSIADRLRAGETVIADRFEEMAVLFADVVGFTALSARLTPNEVVTLLNDVFTRCDRLADRFHLEKIKTVGDAYMVVGGLGRVHGLASGDYTTHAEDVAEMGLAIIDAVHELGRERDLSLDIRVGMHVGPAVAGVIGLKKFIYDVWGDTVNTASRMESTGVPGRLQVTPETRERLKGRFEFERRGPVDVKGKGIIETWFLVGRRTT
jgi:class 3 adenylate cyclase